MTKIKLYLSWSNLKCQSHATTIWKMSSDLLISLADVNDTVSLSYDRFALQFTVLFMSSKCQSICQRETCVIGGGLLERAWQTRWSKAKPWTIFLLHAWKSITQTPVVNARKTDPTQRWAPPPVHSPSLTPLDLLSLHLTPESQLRVSLFIPVYVFLI